jgi:cobalt transporter subunit CbtA
MSHFGHIVATGLLAGLVAGLWLSAARQLWVVPLILQAEALEHAAPPHGHPPGIPEHATGTAAVPLVRHAWTWAANVLTYSGFALMVVAGMALTGRGTGTLHGLGWGLAGFAVFSLAPGIALPPALPGVPEAPLPARQGWWLSVVLATGCGLALLLLARGRGWRWLGLPLLALPHILTAPRAGDALTGPLAGLTRGFAAVTLVINLSAWLVLGAASGWLWSRLAEREQPPRAG